ncbi:hypothetical protein EO93_12885 [Methanosarcina sp. 1.H.A.2.2]|nr:hypothetical protein EO93_12885 [Methanosarcina sp. 1.H.A.2.2]
MVLLSEAKRTAHCRAATLPGQKRLNIANKVVWVKEIVNLRFPVIPKLNSGSKKRKWKGK